jgi:hypothetical protein
MDGLIRTAWRAFWIGLGASAVLIGQSVIVLPPPGPATFPGDPAVAPAAPLAPAAAPLAPAAARRKSADPLSVRCESIGHALRCS